MGTSQKCSKCNQEHDLSLAKCPETTAAVSRVLPPGPPKPSPSARVETKKETPTPIKHEVPKATVLMTAESIKTESKGEKTIADAPKIDMGVEKAEAQVLAALHKLEEEDKAKELEAASNVEAPVVVVEPPKEIIPPNTKSSSPSLAALAASLEAPSKPEVRAEPRNETQLSGDALVLPPQSAKDKVVGLYQQQLAPQLKGREKLVGGVAVGLVVLLLGWALWPNSTTPQATITPKESPLFSAAPPVTPSTLGADSEPASTTTDQTIPLHIEASPASTVIVVWVDGAVFHSGAAPLDINIPRDSAVEVTLAAAGYAPEQKTFTAKEEKTIKESLSKLGAKSSGGNGKSGGSGSKSGGGWGGWGGK